MLISIVLIDGRFTSTDDDDDDNDSDMEPLLDSLRKRFLLERYLPFEERAVREFTEEQRRFQNDTLIAHNILRARHCVPPLELDDEINVRAQEFAEVLASNASNLYHSTNRMGRFGENLYSLTRTKPINFADGL